MKRIISIIILITFITAFVPAVHSDTALAYVYDANGNLISGDGKYYEYDDANKLVRVRHGDANGAVIAEYFYDYNGQRIKKVENGVTTYYVGKHYEEVRDGADIKKTDYYFANGERVAKKDLAGNVYYYHSDHLGGTNVITNSSGNLVERIKYYPFGEIREGENEKYSFTGKEKDKLTDIYYFEARYYNPEFKHFTQADTVSLNLYDPQDLNRYAYVRNNPLRFVDPTGHEKIKAYGREWNSKENLLRYENALREQGKYQQEAAKAWRDYANMLTPSGLLSGAGTKVKADIEELIFGSPSNNSGNNTNVVKEAVDYFKPDVPIVGQAKHVGEAAGKKMDEKFRKDTPAIQNDIYGDNSPLLERGGFASGLLIIKYGLPTIEEGAKEGAKEFVKEEAKGVSRDVLFGY